MGMGRCYWPCRSVENGDSSKFPTVRTGILPVQERQRQRTRRPLSRLRKSKSCFHCLYMEMSPRQHLCNSTFLHGPTSPPAAPLQFYISTRPDFPHGYTSTIPHFYTAKLPPRLHLYNSTLLHGQTSPTITPLQFYTSCL